MKWSVRFCKISRKIWSWKFELIAIFRSFKVWSTIKNWKSRDTFETIRIERYEKLGQTEFVAQNESDHRRTGAWIMERATESPPKGHALFTVIYRGNFLAGWLGLADSPEPLLGQLKNCFKEDWGCWFSKGLDRRGLKQRHTTVRIPFYKNL